MQIQIHFVLHYKEIKSTAIYQYNLCYKIAHVLGTHMKAMVLNEYNILNRIINLKWIYGNKYSANMNCAIKI